MIHTMVDGHAHLHPCFDETRLLDDAWANLAEAGLPQGNYGILLMASISPSDPPFKLRCSEGWQSDLADHAQSIRYDRRDGGGLLVVQAQQIVTREGIEVLVIAPETPVPGGRSMDATLQTSIDVDGVCVLPWGFGKWWGQRGQIVQRVVENSELPFLLGDNGGRPRILPRPWVAPPG